ncbi:MAG: 5'-methylthioadenosine/S-adenosylhomocysteine nucleosidase [Bacillota bacterium]|nr:5'-methylthioadenosine/S-adenosylhomocysteine nucleosidase [Bacillota bacterium]HWR56672.1 5'-methylthioadenosine/S-adenosylhomocysteine nucleosidase [Negativicutes bacterium]
MTLGVLGALGAEVEPLLDKIKQVQRIDSPVGVFYQGDYEGHRLILGVTGTQKTSAAAATQALISVHGPKAVFFTGVAGALNPELTVGDIVIGSTLIHHDAGFLYGKPHAFIPCGPRIAAPFSDAEKVLWGRINQFCSDHQLILAARKASDKLSVEDRRFNIREGVIATGDQVIFSGVKRAEIEKNFGALAVETEGAAFAQVAWTNRVPFLVIRGISDDAHERSVTEERIKLLTSDQPIAETNRTSETRIRLNEAAKNAALFTWATMEALLICRSKTA